MRTSATWILLTFLVTLASPCPANDEQVWLSSLAEAQSIATQTERLLLVDLYADWCGWCKRLEKEVFSDPLFESYASRFVLLRVDTEDGGEGARLQDRYRAVTLPTMLILNQDLVMVGQVQGFKRPADYVRAIEHELRTFQALVAAYDGLNKASEAHLRQRLADEFHWRVDGVRAAKLYDGLLADSGKDDSPLGARNRLLLADSLLLAGDLEGAKRQTEVLYRWTEKHAGHDYSESLDRLSVLIAEAEGSCEESRSALVNFLSTYPRSRFRRYATQSLKSLVRGDTQCS